MLQASHPSGWRPICHLPSWRGDRGCDSDAAHIPMARIQSHCYASSGGRLGNAVFHWSPMGPAEARGGRTDLGGLLDARDTERRGRRGSGGKESVCAWRVLILLTG